MKTTLEIPDALFRKAKAQAASSGITLKRLFNEALEARVETSNGSRPDRPWMKAVAGMKRDAAFHRDMKRIEKAIEETFEVIDPEDCK